MYNNINLPERPVIEATEISQEIIFANIIRLIKLEANNRIEKLLPVYQQINYPRGDKDKILEWKKIDAIRAASNELEKQLESMEWSEFGEKQIKEWHGWL